MKRNIFLMADAAGTATGGGGSGGGAAAPAKTVNPLGDVSQTKTGGDGGDGGAGGGAAGDAGGAGGDGGVGAGAGGDKGAGAGAAGDKNGNGKPPVPGDKRAAGRKDPVAEQRRRIEEQNTQLASITRERDELKQKFEDAQKRGGGDAEAFTKATADRDKEIQSLRSKLAAKDYSQHPDFIAKFEKPFQNAASDAKNVIESLQVREPDGNGGFKMRKAEFGSDFRQIYNSDRATARQMAKEKFGDDAPEVMAEYDKIHRLDQAKSDELKNWSANAEEREKTERAETVRKQGEATAAFNKATDDMIEQNAEFYRDNPENKEEVALRQKSSDLVNAAYFGRDKLTPHEQLVLDAAVRLRAINYPVVISRLNAVIAERNELRARIEGKAQSRGGDTRHKDGQQQQQEPEDWRADLRKSNIVT